MTNDEVLDAVFGVETRNAPMPVGGPQHLWPNPSDKPA